MMREIWRWNATPTHTKTCSFGTFPSLATTLQWERRYRTLNVSGDCRSNTVEADMATLPSVEFKTKQFKCNSLTTPHKTGRIT